MNTSSQTQRASFTAALSVAEALLAGSPVLPSSVELQVYPWTPATPAVVVYFHDEPDSVRQFAGRFELVATDTTRPDGAVHTEASGLLCGVQVRAWSLLSAEQVKASAPIPVVTLAEAVALMGALPMPTAGELAEQRHPLDHVLEHLADERTTGGAA
ncbi:hypothetical protein ACIGNW_00075 [Streptomyces sp. NPDC053707]|uniref:hypothetical protein n=1 Tax=Streptomyces sp. NPDC053707 TaxID=3365712 RepID=UPI0037CDC885